MIKKWISKSGKRLAGILLSKNSIELRYEIPEPEKKIGKTVGADTGLKTTVTLSNKDTTPLNDIHNHSMQSICEKITKKKKGSKAFKKAQDHRKNFINWSIKQLNFNEIGQVNLEKLFDMKRGKRTSKLLTAWSGSLIQKSLIKYLEELGVQVILQSSPYRSQRCSRCGIVRSSNRKGKIYKCKDCGIEIDSDLNAAMNHEVELPEIRYEDRQYLSKLPFFYWKESGVIDNIGQEFRVPVIKES